MLRPAAVYLCLLGLLLLSIPSALRAGEEEFDYARFKLQLNGWVSSPTGYFNGKNGNGYSDVQRDFGFGNYVTFAGRVDWRFKRKHHLFFVTTPVISPAQRLRSGQSPGRGKLMMWVHRSTRKSTRSSSRLAISTTSSGSGS